MKFFVKSLIFLVTLMSSPIASADWLTDDGKSLIIPTYGIGINEGDSEAKATTSFTTGHGDTQLGLNGYIEVNGVRLQGGGKYSGTLPFRTQVGYGYRGIIPITGKEYTFHLVRGPGQEYRHSIIVEPFTAEVPRVASRSHDLVFAVTGAPLRPGEHFLAWAQNLSEYGYGNVKPTALNDSTLVIPSSYLLKIPDDKIKLTIIRSYREPLDGFSARASVGGGYGLKPILVELHE